MSILDVAKDLDLTQSSLRNWVKQAAIDEGKSMNGALTTDERKELRRLRRDNRILEQERDFLKKPRPSSPKSRIRVRADRGEEGRLSDCVDEPSSWCVTKRLLRLACKGPAHAP